MYAWLELNEMRVFVDFTSGITMPLPCLMFYSITVVYNRLYSVNDPLSSLNIYQPKHNHKQSHLQ